MEIISDIIINIVFGRFGPYFELPCVNTECIYGNHEVIDFFVNYCFVNYRLSRIAFKVHLQKEIYTSGFKRFV